MPGVVDREHPIGGRCHQAYQVRDEDEVSAVPVVEPRQPDRRCCATRECEGP